jgi:hypothetical protein
MFGTHIAIGTLAMSLLMGCASSGTSSALEARKAELARSVANVSESCAVALTDVDRLERMKEKAEARNVGTAIASTSNNFWAAIPVPGAKFLGATQKDRDELGMYNKDGCWKLSCVEEKLAESRAAVEAECGSGKGLL